VSVDTYLKGKQTSNYQKVLKDDVTILVAPKLRQYTKRIEIVTQKKLIGSKLLAVAYHEHGASCRH